MRLRLDLAYAGTAFRGWARQPGLRTVQGVLEHAITRVLGGEPQLVVAGRTDAGVHAAAQVAGLERLRVRQGVASMRAVHRTGQVAIKVQEESAGKMPLGVHFFAVAHIR